MKRAALAFFFVPLLAACENLPLSEFLPTVNFQTLDVAEVDFQHIDADFVFTVDNPNPVQVGLSSFSYALALEEIELLSGDNEEGFQLEAVGSSELVLPMSLTWQQAWDTVQATRGEDMVGFGLDGHFGFNTPLGEARLPYDEGGEFPAVRTPKFRFQNVRVKALDLYTQEADLEIDLGVDNEHASTLWFDAFKYKVSMEGTQVANGTIPELGGVEGAQEGSLVLPVTIDLLEAGVQVTNALVNQEPLNLGLKADMDVDSPFGIIPLSINEKGKVSVSSN